MLRKLFLYPFLQNWMYYVIGHLVFAIFLSLNRGEITGLLQLVTGAFAVAAVISPFLLLYILDPFVNNIKWMINNYCSRKKLITFHFLYQPLKFSLAAVPILFYKYIESDISKVFVLEESGNTYWGHLGYFIIPFGILYITTLIRRKQFVPQQQPNPLGKHSKLKQFLIFLAVMIIIAVVLLLIRLLGDSFYFVFAFMMIFIIGMGIASFSEEFILWRKKKLFKIFYICTSIYAVISLIHLFDIRNTVKDETVETGVRVEYVNYLNLFSPKLSSKDLELLLLSTNKDTFGEFVDLNFEYLNFDSVVNHAFKNKMYVHLLDEVEDRNRPLPRDAYFYLLDKFIELAGDKRLKEQIVHKLHKIIIKNNYSDLETINKFFNMKKVFPQYLALEMTFHHIDKDKWWEVLKPHKENLDKSLVERCFEKKEPEELKSYLNKK